MKPYVTIAIAAMLFGGVAMARSTETCLRADEVDGFKNAHQGSVVLTVRGLNWLAEVAGGCLDLDDVQELSTVARSTCVEQGDRIAYRDRNGMLKQCMITRLTFQPREK